MITHARKPRIDSTPNGESAIPHGPMMPPRTMNDPRDISPMPTLRGVVWPPIRYTAKLAASNTTTMATDSQMRVICSFG
jgi:hypothetical protein